MTVLRRAIQKLGPYQSLALLLVPVTLVEPLKLVALVVAGEGHWLTGTAMIVGAYAVSLLVVERLFKVVKPKLMSLSWFARLWKWWVALRNKLNPVVNRSRGRRQNRLISLDPSEERASPAFPSGQRDHDDRAGRFPANLKCGRFY